MPCLELGGKSYSVLQFTCLGCSAVSFGIRTASPWRAEIAAALGTWSPRRRATTGGVDRRCLSTPMSKVSTTKDTCPATHLVLTFMLGSIEDAHPCKSSIFRAMWSIGFCPSICLHSGSSCCGGYASLAGCTSLGCPDAANKSACTPIRNGQELLDFKQYPVCLIGVFLGNTNRWRTTSNSNPFGPPRL